MTAREYMRRAREAAKEARRIRRQLSHIDELGTTVAGRYIRQADRLRKRLEEEEGVINQAVDLIASVGLCDSSRYGSDGESSREKILILRYAYGEKWEPVARYVSYSVRQAQAICASALDYMDETGVFNAMT